MWKQPGCNCNGLPHFSLKLSTAVNVDFERGKLLECVAWNVSECIFNFVLVPISAQNLPGHLV